MSSSSSSSPSTENETTETNGNDISAHVSIVRDGRVTSPPWTIVETSSSFAAAAAAAVEEEEEKDDDFVFAFSLAPGGLGRLTIVNAFGWSYALSSVNGEVDLRYFLDVRAVASSSAVAVSVQNHTYRAKVGFLALSSSSFSSEEEGNSTTTGNPTTTSSMTTSGFGEYSFPLQRAADAGLVNFNAVSFADESNVGGNVQVRSVRLRASSSGEDEGDGPTPMRGTFATTNQAEGGALLLPAFEDAIVENVGNETGVIGGEEKVTFLFDAKDEDSEKALIIGVSVTCTLLLVVLVVVGYIAKKRIKKGKHFTDRSEIASEDRAHQWVQHLERLHSKSSLGGESAAFDATTTTTTHSRPFTPLSWKASRSKRRSSGEGGNIDELENETVVHISGEIDNDEKKKEKKTNKEKSSEARRLMAPASAKKPPSTLEIPVQEDVVRRASTKPPKSNVSSSLPTTEESPRGGIDRLQLLRRSTKDTTPAHSPAISRQNSLLHSIDGDMENATETRISLDALAKEIQKLQESLQNDTNSSKSRSRSRSRSSSSSSSSKLELTPDKEDEVPFENLTEVELEKDVRIYERLGGGAYGTVYRGKFREREVAIKTLRVNALPTATSASTITPTPSNDEEVSEDIKMLKSEVEILRLAKHENIVSVFAACFTPIHKASLIVQLVHGGSLNEMLHRENNESVKLSGSLLKTILLDVAKAMEYLHGLTPRKILHRDLKPQNVLVEAKVVSDVPEKRRKRRGDDDDIFSDNIDDGDTAPTLKYKAYVCDFGISRLLPLMANTLKTSTSHTNAGTSNYMAPELFTNDYPCSTKVDVFSFGNIVYECATGRIPFEKESHLRITYLVGMHDKRAEILPEDEVRGDVSELIKTCWKTDPKERPSFAEIVQTIARFPNKKNFDETKEE